MFKTVTYSQTPDYDVKFDLFLPPADVLAKKPGPLSAIVSFHPGSCVCGHRNDSAFPHWLQEPSLAKGIVFMSADYRLLVPATSFDEVEDVKNLFKYLASSEFSERYLPAGNPLDSSRIGVVGFSGGGHIANLAAVHADPKPKVVCLCWAQGCDWLNSKYVAKSDEIVSIPYKYDEARALELLNTPEKQTSESRGTWHNDIPLLEDEDRRLNLFFYWCKIGETLDYITGEKGLADKLRGLKTEAERIDALPDKVKPLFPQLFLDQYPPTVLIHGDKDDVVAYEDSVKMHEALRNYGKETELYTLDGEPHAMVDIGIITDPTRVKLKKAFEFMTQHLL